jgi:hypothetical protein
MGIARRDNVKPANPLTHLPFMALAALTLLAAMWAGLIRIGWEFPPLRENWIANHGPLMISGFLGTVISLERAVALAAMLKARWPYAAPLFAGLGAVVILVGLPTPYLSGLVGRGLITLGSLGMVLIFVRINRIRLDWPYAIMGLGALLWLAGDVLWWLYQPINHVVPWWVGFLVLTIAGERLELARVLLLRRSALVTFLISAGIFLIGLVLSGFAAGIGVRVGGVGLIALGLWLLRYDLARRTIRQKGLTRFIAACLLPGYVWLIFAGALWLWWADRFTAGPLYDAMLHSLLLGYVFSMIFGHAPIILPAVMSVAMNYSPAFYAHLALLHLSLVLRVTGDLAFADPFNPVRRWGGMLNVIALLVFLANTIRSARRAPQGSLTTAH